MRITNNTLQLEMQKYVGINRSGADEQYIKISSGKKYLNRSEDPVATSEIAMTQTNIQETEQWERNLELAANWELSSEALLSDMVSNMQRVRELAVEANTGVNNPEDRLSISVEIDSIINSLVNQLNSSYSGTPMFAGRGLRPTGHAGRWNELTMGTKPVAGDPGMPAVGGNDWDDLTQAEYTAWEAAQTVDVGTVAGNTVTASASPPDWSNLDLSGARVRITAGPAAGTTGVIQSNNGNSVTVERWDGTAPPAGALSYEIIDFAPGWVDHSGQAFTATRNSDDQIITVTYNGSTNQRGMQVYENATTISYGTIGHDMVNFESREYDNASSSWQNVSVNLFDTLIKVRDDLANGEKPNDVHLERLNRGLNNIVTRNVENGVSQTNIRAQLNTTTANYDSSMVRLSDLESLDIASAISELNEMEAALQASLQMIPRMNSLRLIDFI